MADNLDNIILEHLKAIRADISALKTGQSEIKDVLIATRNDVHSLKGDVLRLERGLASVEHDVERIKRRLDLSDSTGA